MKKKSGKKHRLLLNSEFIGVLISCAALGLLGCIFLLITSGEENVLDFIDTGVFFSVTAAFLLGSLTTLLSRFFAAKYEDNVKLTDNYDALAKTYCRGTTLITYRNSANADYKTGRRTTSCRVTEDEHGCDFYRFPVADKTPIAGKAFVIHDDRDKMYSLPTDVSQNMLQLYHAHSFSTVYNQLMVRLDSLKSDETEIHAYTSRTYYLYSLMTNRAADYKIEGLSVRDLYDCGPFLKTLEESVLSNHLGYNGFVETSDGYFVFIFRHKHVSIGKNTLQASVGASLKVKYALDDDKTLTVPGIESAIKNEILEELNLKNLKDFNSRKETLIPDFSFGRNVLYFYRDLVECGKPQLMFYTRIAVTSEELRAAYTAGIRHSIRTRDKFGLYCAIDGYKMLLVHRSELKNIYITPDGFVINHRFYKAVPSAAATLVMMLEALGKE